MFYDTEDLRNEEILLRLERTCDAQPEKQWVPAYYFAICLPDGTKIGSCDLRIGHNERLYIGGNIGYGIDEAFRGRRYAAKACKLLFRLARKHQLGYVIITCDPENTASSRTCELAGGQYLETAPVPQDHNMYGEGKRQVMVYRFDLEEENGNGSAERAIPAGRRVSQERMKMPGAVSSREDNRKPALKSNGAEEHRMDIAYRKLTENDLGPFISMRIAQLREEGATEDLDLRPALMDYYHRHLADGTFVSWLALDGERIIGTSGMSFVEKPPYFSCPSGRIGLLSSMYTDPGYRRMGIAKELLGRVVEEARRYGCGSVQITASDMGVLLYTDFGFVKNGNFMQYIL